MPILENPRHEHFAQRLANGDKPTVAAQVAGYSEKSCAAIGSRLSKKVNIVNRVAEVRAVVTERAIEKGSVDKAWVLAELVENVKMGKSAEAVLNEDGEPIGEYKQNLQAANKALELIGKECGMFIDRKEIRTGPLTSLTDQQLDQLIAALVAGTPAEVFAVLGHAGEAAPVQGKPAGVLPPLH